MEFHLGREWNETVPIYIGKGTSRHLEQITIHHGVYTEVEIMILTLFIISLGFLIYIHFRKH